MHINRRENPRMDVKLKCRIGSARMWPSALEGLTENISRNGISMYWQAGGRAVGLPRVGDLVTVEVELPANHNFARKCIHCQATVVRVSKLENSAVRFAVSINYMKFRDYESDFQAMQIGEPESSGARN